LTKASDATYLEGAEPIQRGLEVVQDNHIRETLEDKGQFPKGVDSDRECGFESAGDRTNVENDEDDADNHREEHYAKARRYSNDL
jgi:hypothetical protein